MDVYQSRDHPEYTPAKQRAIEAAVKRYPMVVNPRAALVCAFLEDYCLLTKGGRVADPFVLMPWQTKCLDGLYAGWPNAERIITRGLISIGRKNGKSELASALVLCHLCGPEAGRGDEILCAAAGSEAQAAIVWDGARKMAQMNPTLAPKFTFRLKRFVYDIDRVNNYAETITTKVSSAQGKIPSFFTLDEIAEATDRGLYEALHYGQTDQKTGGLGLIITTRSTRANSLFTSIHDDVVAGQQLGKNRQWYVKVFSADAAAENLYTMEQVKAANPAMGYILSEKVLRDDLEEAINNEGAREGFKARRLNIESGQTGVLVDPTAWKALAVPEEREALYERMKGKRAILAIDLGSTRSMTSLAIYWPDEKTVSVMNWMAKSQVKKNETIHKAPYSAWVEGGHLQLIASEAHGGMTYAPIAEHIDRCYKEFDVVSFRYDGWNFGRLTDALSKFDLTEDTYPLKGTLDKFIQGNRSYGEAIIEFDDLVLNKQLKHDDNPCTNMGMFVCQTEIVNTTTDELRKPVKNKQQLPNDPAIAVIMAVCSHGLVLEEEATMSFAEMRAAAKARVAARKGVV